NRVNVLHSPKRARETDEFEDGTRKTASKRNLSNNLASNDKHKRQRPNRLVSDDEEEVAQTLPVMDEISGARTQGLSQLVDPNFSHITSNDDDETMHIFGVPQANLN